MFFLNLVKAYDRVTHQLIWASLRSHSVPEAYINWVQILYLNNYECCPLPCRYINPVRHQHRSTPRIGPFATALHHLHGLQIPHPWTLLYAEDILLADTERQNLQDHTQWWKDRLDQNAYGLTSKRQSTWKVPPPNTSDTISIDGIDLKKVTKFRYLGSNLSADGDSLPDIRLSDNAVRQRCLA